jgi:RNase P/RNase MRP subunit POP5
MLRRRAKRRYLSILHAGQATETVDLITRRCSELFGSVAAEQASIRLVRSDGTTVIKCRLDKLDSVLAAIALSSPPIVSLGMSGSVKQLLRRR